MAFHPQKSHLAEIGGRKPKAAPKPPDSPLHWVLRWGENSQAAKWLVDFGVAKTKFPKLKKGCEFTNPPEKMMGGWKEDDDPAFPFPFWVSANFQGANC